MLRQIAEGVLIHESEFCRSNAVSSVSAFAWIDWLWLAWSVELRIIDKVVKNTIIMIAADAQIMRKDSASFLGIFTDFSMISLSFLATREPVGAAGTVPTAPARLRSLSAAMQRSCDR